MFRGGAFFVCIFLHEEKKTQTPKTIKRRNKEHPGYAPRSAKGLKKPGGDRSI